MRLNGKIQKYQSQSQTNLSFRIVHNFWKNGIGTNKLIKTIVKIPENKLDDALYQTIAWEKIEKALANLKSALLLSDANAETIRKRFSMRLPRPIRPAPIGKLSQSKKDINLSKYSKFLD